MTTPREIRDRPAYPSLAHKSPTLTHDHRHTVHHDQPSPGMTIRQAYKIGALSFMADPKHSFNETAGEVAEWSGMVADALLAEDAAHESSIEDEKVDDQYAIMVNRLAELDERIHEAGSEPLLKIHKVVWENEAEELRRVLGGHFDPRNLAGKLT